MTNPEPLKVAGDVIGGLTVAGVLLKWLPVILAVPAAVYACLRIYEWFVKKRWRK